MLIFQGLSIAAVFCIAFFIGSIYNKSNDKIFPETSAATTYSEIKAPLGARSEIKLGDGTQIILNAGSTIKIQERF